MQALQTRTKDIVGLFSELTEFLKNVLVSFGISREGFVVFLCVVVLALAVFLAVYFVLFFRHYRYTIENNVIKIRKGALFKRRHLLYLDKIGMITVKENFVQRMFSLCTVYFYVQGTEFRLSFVNKDSSDKLKEILDSRD